MKGVQIVRTLSSAAASSNALVRPPIALFGTNGRYCNALYSAAYKQKKLDQVEADLKKLLSVLEKDVKFKEFLINPLININDKKSILGKVLNEKLKVCDLTLNTLNVMAENRRLNVLSQVARDFSKIMASVRGEVECTVYTAKPVTDANVRKQLEDSLRGFTSKKLTINLQVDEAIQGGLVVDFGDYFIDMSIRSKLKTFTDVLKQTV